MIQCQVVASKFEFYTNREWVFDAASVNKIRQVTGSDFEMDCNKIQWRSYSMNLGYGIKNYILQEEAVMPSMGYNDVVARMKRSAGQLLPWSKAGQPAEVRGKEEMTKLIMSKEWVKKEMAALVAQKLAYYRGQLHLDVTEDKVYREVEKAALTNIDTIVSNYNHTALRWMA